MPEVVVSLQRGEPTRISAATLDELRDKIETTFGIPKAHQALMANGVKVHAGTP